MLMPRIFGENLLDDFFDDFYAPAKPGFAGAHPFNGLMKTDVKENENGFELNIDLPGYGKEDVTAELKNGYLTINATKKTEDENKENGGRYIRRERFYGSCSRSFYVGKQVTEEDIKAKFENGILIVTIPKKEDKPKIEDKKYIPIEG
ncbi:MAG: Hsp20/alpha crystallin family protein [Lachnospiraceae bacterium]|nr:Hsp20/alpha crystallin family protein [Lachnospiraceae bacterium]